MKKFTKICLGLMFFGILLIVLASSSTDGSTKNSVNNGIDEPKRYTNPIGNFLNK